MNYDEPKKRDSQETGMDEVLRHASGQGGYAWTTNAKRTYDEYQHESLESIKRNRTIVDKYVADAQNHDNDVRNISTQALQNAVETANMVGKQAIRHSDVAADALWSDVEAGVGEAQVIKANQLNEVVRKAVDAAVASVVASMASGRPPVNTSGN